MNPKSQMTFKFGLGVVAEMILVVLESRGNDSRRSRKRAHVREIFVTPYILERSRIKV